MSHESTPLESAQYSNRHNRRGLASGEAIFGDKHRQFEGFTPNAQEVFDDFDEAATEQRHAGNPKAIAELALREAATAGDWSPERIAAAQTRINKQFKEVE